MLDPVHRERTVWHLGYQDVWAMGRVILTGSLDATRIVALGGPTVKNPRLIRSRLGACLSELTDGELLADQESRIVSGSILSGRQVDDNYDYLGRYHNQVSALAEDRTEFSVGSVLA